MTTSCVAWLLSTSTPSSCVLSQHDPHKIKAVNSPSWMEKGNMTTHAQPKSYLVADSCWGRKRIFFGRSGYWQVCQTIVKGPMPMCLWGALIGLRRLFEKGGWEDVLGVGRGSWLGSEQKVVKIKTCCKKNTLYSCVKFSKTKFKTLFIFLEV